MYPTHAPVVHQYVLPAQIAQERDSSQALASSFTIAQLVDEIVQGNDPAAVVCHTDITDKEHQIPAIPDWALADVADWQAGKKELIIDEANSLHYLNAAKYRDLTEASNERSTYAIRLECLLKNPKELTTLEAFSYRLNPKFFSQKDEQGKYLPNKKFELYDAGESELSFVPEWQEVQKAITRLVTNTVCSFSDQLGFKDPHLILFTGTYGSGKSYQTKHHPLMKAVTIDQTSPFSGVLSSDAIKRVYMSMVPGTTNEQVHYEGVALRLQIMKSLFRHYPNLTIIQEAVLNSDKSVEEIIAPCIAKQTKLKIICTDTDLATACLSILTRSPGESIPLFKAIITAEANIRNARKLLHSKVESYNLISDYELLYREPNGISQVARKEDGRVTFMPGHERLQSGSDTETIESVRTRLITEQDVTTHGDTLKKFVGMSIEDALIALSRL